MLEEPKKFEFIVLQVLQVTSIVYKVKDDKELQKIKYPFIHSWGQVKTYNKMKVVYL